LAGVVDDVLAGSVEVFFVPDDVFVVVSLPDGRIWRAPEAIDAFGGTGFEGAYDHAKGVACWVPWRSVVRGGGARWFDGGA
jgi:hypothetical protein